MDRSTIHVVAISRCFGSVAELVDKVKAELGAFRGKPVVLLFPEAVLGRTNPNGVLIPLLIERKKGKELAQELHRLAARHGQAYIAYSALESFPERASAKQKRLPDGSLRQALEPNDYSGAVNAGYLISPKKEPIGYQVYPKLTTYTGGTRLTKLHENQLVWHYYNLEKLAERVSRRAAKVKRFPEVLIGGKRVQMRVCSDASAQKDLSGKGPYRGSFSVQDFHRARESEQVHLLLVPSQGNYFVQADLEHIVHSLMPKGIGVAADPNKNLHGAKVFSSPKNGHLSKVVEKDRPVKKGFFWIHHKP